MSMTVQAAIKKMIAREDLQEQEMTQVMQLIMQGKATPAQLGAFLIGLRMKGEVLEEIIAAVKVMRSMSEKVPIDLTHAVDTCGTGGDGLKTFNISTASAFVVAAAGARVAKHGSRSVSSTSGSADVLEKAGVNIDLNAEQVAQCINELGIGFMFAPIHHTAMKHVVVPRREMGVRTVFNLLGPMTNPANVKNQVIGVFDRQWLEPMANVLLHLGSEHVILVHSEEGLDEVSISGKTHVCELKGAHIHSYTVEPSEFSLECYPVNDLSVDTSEESLAVIRAVLSGEEQSAARNIVLLNAGAAIYVSGRAAHWKDGVIMATEMIDKGLALQKLDALIKLTSGM